MVREGVRAAGCGAGFGDGRGWSAVVAHVDLDCFFAQAEELDEPGIRGRPVIVGPRAPVRRGDGTVDFGASGRGIVCTANYAARAFGVRTAMPAAMAHRLCPEGVYRRPRGERYRELSDAVFEACRAFTPEVRRVGIDEGYLGLSGLDRWLRGEVVRGAGGGVGAPEGGAEGEAEVRSVEGGWFGVDWPLLLARRVRRHVRRETGLDLSVGVGPNRMVAKLASDYDKPRGCTAVRPGLCGAFVGSLPLGDLRGVGPAMVEKLRRLGVRRSVDVIDRERDEVVALLGEFGARLWDDGHGADGAIPDERERRKSVSRDTTFGEDVAVVGGGRETLDATLAMLVEKAAFQLRREALFAGTVGVRVRFADFSEVQHERALGRFAEAAAGGVASSQEDGDLLPAARALLEEVLTQGATGTQRGMGVRLIGVKMSKLGERGERQMVIGADEEGAERRSAVYRAADAVRARLGAKAISSGAAIAGRRGDRSRRDLGAEARDDERVGDG